MTVIDLHKSLQGELRDAWAGLGRCGFSDTLVSKVLCALLGPSRLSLLKRSVLFIATLHAAKVDPLTAIFVDEPSMFAVQKSIAAAGPAHLVEKDRLVLRLSDGKDFHTSLNGVRGLICALRTVTECLGFGAFDKVLDGTQRAKANLEELETVALDLSKQFDRYRNARVGSMQLHRKFRAIVQFLKQCVTMETYTALDINSEHVLQFWEIHADIENLNVKKYQSAHTSFLAFQSALDNTLELAADERLPETRTLDSGADTSEDWEALIEDGREIAFLKSVQYKRLAPLTGLSPLAHRMTASALRVAKVSPVENRLKDQMSANEYDQVLSQLMTGEDVAEMLEKDMQKFHSACRAALHVLIQNERPPAVHLASAFARGPLFDESDVSLPSDPNMEQMDQLGREMLVLLAYSPEPRFEEVRIDAAAAWKRTEREGLRQQDLYDQDIVDLIDRLTPRIIGAYAHIQRCGLMMRSARGAETPDIEGRFDACWRRLYQIESKKGVGNDTHI